MGQEKINLNLGYGFKNDRDFSLIEKNLGQKFDKEDLDNIDGLLKGDRSIIIEHFHNFFSLNENNTLREIELSLERGLPDEETKKIYQIFYTFLKKYGWSICMNIESFVEEYKNKDSVL